VSTREVQPENAKRPANKRYRTLLKTGRDGGIIFFIRKDQKNNIENFREDGDQTAITASNIAPLGYLKKIARQAEKKNRNNKNISVALYIDLKKYPKL